MRKLNQNSLLYFESEDGVFEFLVKESQRHTIKEQWKKEMKQLAESPSEKKGINWRFYNKRIVVFIIALI